MSFPIGGPLERSL